MRQFLARLLQKLRVDDYQLQFVGGYKTLHICNIIDFIQIEITGLEQNVAQSVDNYGRRLKNANPEYFFI